VQAIIQVMIVRAADPDRQTLAGHMLAHLLARAVADPRLRASLARRRYRAGLVVSGMATTLELAGDAIVLHDGLVGRLAATLRTDLVTLLGVAAGGSLVRAWLAGRLGVGGNPFRLLPLLPLLSPSRLPEQGAS
jgi:hypothetical protein